MTPRVSVIVTAYNEGSDIVSCLDRLIESITVPFEILVVYDSLEDTTRQWVEKYQQSDPRILPTLNEYGPGPSNAIRFGFDTVSAPVTVVTMADGCDDPAQIDGMVRLVERGITVVAASRYMRGGRQIGGPFLKRKLSRIAGLSLYYFGRVGTHDATNSFKAYLTEFVREVGIESHGGFEVGIELVAKARRYRRRVAEVPTIWLDREFGKSNFQLKQWLTSYLHWYFYAFRRPIRAKQDRAIGGHV